MKFLLPSQIPQFDFLFELLRANEYFKWKNGKGFEIAYGDADESYCPVGSIEFCQSHGIHCAPKNIPFELERYAFEGIVYKNELNEFVKYYIKSALKIKDDRNGVYVGIQNPFVHDKIPFQATKYIEKGFVAEWRCFVMDNVLLDIKQYQAKNDEALFVVPNRLKVLLMILDYKHSPCAYTLDIGVADDGNTYVIEVHDFFACGLYKFDDLRYLPAMLWNWYLEYKDCNEKKNQDLATSL